jgi:hypothetical protein
MAAFLVSLLALVLVMVAPAHAGQALYNNGAGFRYTRPMPNPGQWYAPPAARYAAPVPRYYPGYLQGYVRPYRPNPAPFIAGAILGAATQLIPVPVPRPVQGDAIDQITDPIRRDEVVEALERLCEIEPQAQICGKLQAPRQ